MNVILYPERKEWPNFLKRPYVDNAAVLESVQQIMNQVRTGGDAALLELSKRLDGAALHSLAVSEGDIAHAEEKVPAGLKAAIQQAKKNIETFHAAQHAELKKIETEPGIICWQKSIAIEKVGLYIPGGTAPLFSTVLMLGVPAQLAGCREIILCTPPDTSGSIHPAILYTAALCGIKKIYKVGGAQAIAAMAFGTETIPSAYKIYGPGNQYVTAAKQLVQLQGIAIDMPAGPSEVCVLADASAIPNFVAADLLSQAEHGMDSQVLLVSPSKEVVENVLMEIQKQLALLPRRELAAKALQNSKAFVTESMEDAIALVNEYAAEHLILACDDAENIAEKITAAGSVFIGNYAPESAGDYASGTNHTLPTNASARAYSGVSLDSFMKKITFQKLTEQGLQTIAETVITMAEAEGLQAHAEAVKVRLSESRMRV
jgi:histidinol dehydrogenase